MESKRIVPNSVPWLSRLQCEHEYVDPDCGADGSNVALAALRPRE
jgi:hypothetical protein